LFNGLAGRLFENFDDSFTLCDLAAGGGGYLIDGVPIGQERILVSGVRALLDEYIETDTRIDGSSPLAARQRVAY
jgi:hypothetical protein